MASGTIKKAQEIIQVSGRTVAVNTEAVIPFPSGIDPTKHCVVGSRCYGSNGLWYSNNSSVLVFTSSNLGIRVKVTDSTFANQAITVYLVKG